MEAHTALWSVATFVFLPSLAWAKPVFINRVFKPSWAQDRKKGNFLYFRNKLGKGRVKYRALVG